MRGCPGSLPSSPSSSSFKEHSFPPDPQPPLASASRQPAASLPWQHYIFVLLSSLPYFLKLNDVI